MATAFGPQGPNYSTTRPTALADASGGLDTWFVDCSAAGLKDGTLIYADFMNVIIANLRTAVSSSGVALSNTNDSMLYQAIQAIATASALSAVSAGAGIDVAAGVVALDHGKGTLATLTETTVTAQTDHLVVWDVSASAHKELTVYDAVKSVLINSTGITFVDASGDININVPQHTSAASPPASPNVGDTWYDTTDGTLYQFIDNGANNVWVDIS